MKHETATVILNYDHMKVAILNSDHVTNVISNFTPNDGRHFYFEAQYSEEVMLYKMTVAILNFKARDGHHSYGRHFEFWVMWPHITVEMTQNVICSHYPDQFVGDNYYTLKRIRNSCWRVMSVASMRELICLWSSGLQSSISSATWLSNKQPIAERQWWFSKTDVFWKIKNKTKL